MILVYVSHRASRKKSQHVLKACRLYVQENCMARINSRIAIRSIGKEEYGIYDCKKALETQLFVYIHGNNNAIIAAVARGSKHAITL